jgi:hypothetical protein
MILLTTEAMSYSNKSQPTQRAATVLEVKAVAVFYSVGKKKIYTRKGCWSRTILNFSAFCQAEAV